MSGLLGQRGRWLLLGLAGLLAAGGGIWLLFQHSAASGPEFETLVIRGERVQLSAEGIRDRIRPHLADGYFGADLKTLREEMEAEPWVREVSARRQWPSTLELTVVEQTPVAIWNRRGLLNEEGELFVPRELRVTLAGLPELIGPEGSQTEVLAFWRRADARLEATGLRIGRVELSPRRAWLMSLNDGPGVRLGRGQRDGRLERFANVVVPALDRRLAEAEYVDMRYTNGFAVAWRDAPADRGTKDGSNG
jgi:cell division protein FtsQ